MALIRETLINSMSQAHFDLLVLYDSVRGRDRSPRSNRTFVHERFIFRDLHFHYRSESFSLSLSFNLSIYLSVYLSIRLTDSHDDDSLDPSLLRL